MNFTTKGKNATILTFIWTCKNEWYICKLLMNYGFREAYFEYFKSFNFSRENTNIDVSVFKVDLRMIDMSSECEYDWYWKISACSTEYEAGDSFASLTRQQTSYAGSAGWYFRYQSIHIQITYTYQTNLVLSTRKLWVKDLCASIWKQNFTDNVGDGRTPKLFFCSL